MISNFFESDLIQIDPSAFTQVDRLTKPGTSGVVFRAIERQTGRIVAVKISHAEESSKGCLLAEAAALQSPLRSVAEPGSAPTAREYYRRHDPFARVGLVMEWLDDTYTPVEKLVQDPELKLTELQILRIIAPFTALLAAAHKLGYIYVDIGADKADHLWWRVQRFANGQWRVPRGADGRPLFQLKVIDWANAINMSDPAYAGNVTPADDIVGVGALLFYMSRGPHTPLPTSADTTVLQPQKGSLDDIIRRAMFIDAEGSFVREAQRGIITSERRELLRNPEMRSAATVELNNAVRADLAKLSSRYLKLVTRVGDSVRALDKATAQGLLALNKQIPEELAILGEGERLQIASELSAQALDVIEIMKDMISRARKIDPDSPETDLLATDLERLEKVMAERRGLENIRRLLTQVELAPHIDLKRIFDSLARMRKAQTELVFEDDFRLLEQLTYAINEASQLPNGLDAVEDTAVLPGLIEQALDNHSVLTSTGAQEARKTILSLSHWGDGSQMHALRTTISQRAHAPILRDQVTSIIQRVRETKQGIDRDAVNPNVSASTQRNSVASSETLSRLIAKLEDTLNALRATDIAPALATILDAQTIYTALSKTLQELSNIPNVEVFDTAEQVDNLQALQHTIQSIESALVEATSNINDGNLMQACVSLRRFADLDPQSILAQRYVRLLSENTDLDRNDVAIAINKSAPGKVAELLQALQNKIPIVQQFVVRANYLLALEAIERLAMPLLRELAPNAPLVRSTYSQQQPQDGRARLSHEVIKVLREALVTALQPANISLLAAQHLNGGSSRISALSDKLLESYKEIYRWQRPWPSGYRPSPADVQNRMPILIQRLASVDQDIPILNYITEIFRSYAFAACLDQTVEALENGEFDAADEWLHALPVTTPTSEQANTVTVSQALVGAVREWRKTGPEHALAKLSFPSFAQALQASGDYRTSLEFVFGSARRAFEQERETLKWAHKRLLQVNEAIDHEVAALGASRTLNELLDRARSQINDQDSTPLKRDLQVLYQIWTTTLGQARNLNSMSQDWVLELARPLHAAKLSNLARSLEQAEVTDHFGRASGQVRPETVGAVFEPLAGAVRNIIRLLEASAATLRGKELTSVANPASLKPPIAPKSSTGFSVYFGKIAFSSQGAIFDRLSTLSFVGLSIAAFGTFFLALILLFDRWLSSDPNNPNATWANITGLFTPLSWWAVGIGLVVLVLGLIPLEAYVRYQRFRVPMLIVVLFLGFIGVGTTSAYRTLFIKTVDPGLEDYWNKQFKEKFNGKTITEVLGNPISDSFTQTSVNPDMVNKQYKVQYFDSFAFSSPVTNTITNTWEILHLGYWASGYIKDPDEQLGNWARKTEPAPPSSIPTLVSGAGKPMNSPSNTPGTSVVSSTRQIVDRFAPLLGFRQPNKSTNAQDQNISYFDHGAINQDGELVPLGHMRYEAWKNKPLKPELPTTAPALTPTNNTPLTDQPTSTLVVMETATPGTLSPTATTELPTNTPGNIPSSATPAPAATPQPYKTQVNGLLVFQHVPLNSESINTITLVFSTTGQLDTAGFSFWRIDAGNGQFFVEQLNFATAKLEIYHTEKGVTEPDPLNKSNKQAIIEQLPNEMFPAPKDQWPDQTLPDLRSGTITATLVLTPSLADDPGQYSTLLTVNGIGTPELGLNYPSSGGGNLEAQNLAIHFSAQTMNTDIEILSFNINNASYLDELKPENDQP